MLKRLLKLLPAPQIEGYEHPDLVEAIFRKTVAFEPSGFWPEIADARTILDFGGGCGAHYKRAQSPAVRWAVVETPAMVARAKELETDRLRFFTQIDTAANWLGDIDLVHSDGAIQYTPDPIETLIALCNLGASRMHWHRVFLGSKTEMQTSLLQENGPNTISVKHASLSVERIAIPEDVFLQAHRGYIVEGRGRDWFVFVRA